MKPWHLLARVLVAACVLAVVGCSSFLYRTENAQRDTLEQIIQAMPPVLGEPISYDSPCITINIDCTDVGWNATVTTNDSPSRACRAFNEWAAQNHAEIQYVTDRDNGMTPGSVSASYLVDDKSDVKRPYREDTFARECREALEADGFAAVQGTVMPVAEDVGRSDTMNELGLSDLYTAGLMWDERTEQATANVRVVG